MNIGTTYGIISVLAAAASFGITAGLGKVVIPWLKRLHYDQPIKEVGPTWHTSKQGTPTMGGVMFIAGILGACVVALPVFSAVMQAASVTGIQRLSRLNTTYIWAGLVMGLLYGAVGFFDDYIKVVRGQNTGLKAWQKYVLQALIAVAYLASIWLGGDKGAGRTVIPFVGEVELGFWFYLLSVIVITGFVNGVNLTDGIDGLCSSVTFFAVISFMMIAGFRQLFDMGIIASAIAGGCIGFLVWNFFPAKVFMGDTGSLFLGGMFCALAYGVRLPILIPLIGLVYLAEAASVMLQVGYFKATNGKRLFKMSPIHHHLEMSGWNEVKIVTVFSLFTIGCGAIGVLLAALGQ